MNRFFLLKLFEKAAAEQDSPLLFVCRYLICLPEP